MPFPPVARFARMAADGVWGLYTIASGIHKAALPTRTLQRTGHLKQDRSHNMLLKKFAVLALAATFGLAACTTEDPYTGEQKTSKTTYGALGGAVLGALAGMG